MIHHTFAKGPESWCSYDYHASVVADGRNFFVLAAWSPGDGPDGRNCVFADHRQWSADTPESPVSILSLLMYRNWLNENPVDLRDADVSVYVRGDNLDLDGARCTFWVVAPRSRWHLTSQPLHVPQGSWADKPASFRLVNDESEWHNSWHGNAQADRLDRVLGGVHSYGFAFSGFSREVSGRFSIADLKITSSGR